VATNLVRVAGNRRRYNGIFAEEVDGFVSGNLVNEQFNAYQIQHLRQNGEVGPAQSLYRDDFNCGFDPAALEKPARPVGLALLSRDSCGAWADS
jgi:hypothetical protein